jgi:hypothetical protein
MDVYAKCTRPYISPEGIAYGCGTCPMCKKSKSLEWSIRARHELITSKKAVFITLTYDNKHLRREAIKAENRFDRRGVLCQDDVQKFLKRLRRRYSDRKLRYLYCGEYGEEKWRPHYHMLIFGINPIETSNEAMTNIWGMGNADVSNQWVSDNAISYIVGYIKKKIPGRQQNHEKYEGNNRPKPYLRASQGLGRSWSDLHIDEWSTTLSLAYRGYQVAVPRYYIKRAIKKEGLTVKYKTNIAKIGGNVETRYDYKVIENPYGYYTRRIRDKEIRKQYDSYSNWMDKYKLKEKEVAQAMTTYIDVKEKRLMESLLKWDFSKRKTSEDLSRFFERNIYKIRDEHRRLKDTKKLISEPVKKRLNGIAKRKTWEYMHGRYGKRDKLELMEDIIYPELRNINTAGEGAAP